MIFGVEADTSSPWRPSEMGCAISCYQVMSSVYDTLVVTTDDGGWAPYLAESVTPNDDYTVWTIRVRPGVRFHDGTTLDGAAVADNLSRAKNGSLTGVELADVTKIAVNADDPLAADVTMRRPWTTFPIYLAMQIGMIASPTWLRASDSDDTLKAKPVGTGPFVFVDYKSNEFFKAKRNATYWNQPYPFLDAVEFRPVADALQRRDALVSGALDMIHTTNGETIAKYRDSTSVHLEERTYKGATTYTLLHVSQTLDGRNSLAAHRPAGPLCLGQRTGLPDDRRHHRRRRRQAGQWTVFPSAGPDTLRTAVIRRSRTWKGARRSSPPTRPTTPAH